MQPLLTITDLSHSFGGLKALTHLSLEIFPGELVGLIGPNGAGKTTVFNLITGVFPISAGRITFRGDDISDWRSHRITAAGIARTFQNIRLFKDLSVLDNVRLGASAQHRYSLMDALRRSRRFTASEQEVTRQAFELLERFHLTHYAHTPARHLPYGEQRRIEMARALISRPQLLLLDEPAAGMNSVRDRGPDPAHPPTAGRIRPDHPVDRAPDAGGGESLPAPHGPGFRPRPSPRAPPRKSSATRRYWRPTWAKTAACGARPRSRKGGPHERMNRTPLLAVEDVWVSYDRIDAVRGVSFDVQRRRDRHPHRGQRRGQVNDLAGHIRDAAGGPRPGGPGR